MPEETPADIAPAASLRAAAMRGNSPPPIEKEDLRAHVRRQSISALVLFVLDVSDSMGARRRIRDAKGSVYGLLKTAHRMRYRVGLIAVQGKEASLIVPPTSSVGAAKRNMSGLRPAGGTPLASGLRLALHTIHNEELKHPGIEPVLVIISDGEATVPLTRRGDPLLELIELAEKIRKREKVTTICVDTKESSPYETGTAEMTQLSRALGARWCYRSSYGKQQ